MKKIRPVALLLILAILSCSCGSSNEPDGIDSVTYISEMATQPAVQSPEAIDIAISGMGGKPLAEFDGTVFSSSIYILFLKEAFDSILKKYEVAPTAVPDMEILLSDGKIMKGKEYCESYARNEFEWFFLLFSQLSSFGKTLTECKGYPSAAGKAAEDLKTESQLYNNLNITLSDLILYYNYPGLYHDVFVCKYSPNGEYSSVENNLAELMEGSFRKISLIMLPLYEASSNRRYSESERSETIKLANTYLNRYKSGEPFSSVYEESRLLQDPGFSASYNDKSYIFYSISDPFLPKSITEEAERLEDNEASIIIEDNYVCIVQRLPVNEVKDEEWISLALDLAFDSHLGDEFAENMNQQHESFRIQYDELLLSELTLENYIRAAVRK